MAFFNSAVDVLQTLVIALGAGLGISGIVIGRKEGKWMHYSISENGVQYAIDCLQALMITSAAFENKSCCDR